MVNLLPKTIDAEKEVTACHRVDITRTTSALKRWTRLKKKKFKKSVGRTGETTNVYVLEIVRKLIPENRGGLLPFLAFQLK